MTGVTVKWNRDQLLGAFIDDEAGVQFLDRPRQLNHCRAATLSGARTIEYEIEKQSEENPRSTSKSSNCLGC